MVYEESVGVDSAKELTNTSAKERIRPQKNGCVSKGTDSPAKIGKKE
ncbi:hypothetical protein [uncultured Duncaniella sp.]|nr:hypothetical protein [uncultured Duncaniella sp.]